MRAIAHANSRELCCWETAERNGMRTGPCRQAPVCCCLKPDKEVNYLLQMCCWKVQPGTQHQRD